MRGFLNFLANVIWIFLGGLWLFLAWCICGLVLCITIIGIPFGVQCFKIAVISLVPYGKEVITDYSKHPVANVIWAILGGWEMSLLYLIVGVINCITIISIPRGTQCFKITKMALFPFGSVAVPIKKSKRKTTKKRS